jgi:transposase InsO family protein
MRRANRIFEIIKETVDLGDGSLSVSMLCEQAGVSRSGYYRWLASEPLRKRKEEQDKADFNLILTAFRFRGYNKGARGIYMRLLHLDVIMNVKKIRRLMCKYNLFCPIRKANPYRRMMAAMRTDCVADNVLNRRFESLGPRAVMLTDITYIPYIHAGTRVFCYLSVIIDACTKQVMAYRLSESLEVDFVLDTVKDLIEHHAHELKTDTLIHSDQGSHYTSHKFIDLLNDLEITRSMSRKGCCWDNAPQESFFGHMKDEIDISGCRTFREVKDVIDDWMDYYNKDRYVWDLAKLSPDEYYQYKITGKYPLKRGE